MRVIIVRSRPGGVSTIDNAYAEGVAELSPGSPVLRRPWVMGAHSVVNPEGVTDRWRRFIGNPFRVATGNRAGYPGCLPRPWAVLGYAFGVKAPKNLAIISIVARRRLFVCGGRSRGGASGCGDGVPLIRRGRGANIGNIRCCISGRRDIH